MSAKRVFWPILAAIGVFLVHSPAQASCVAEYMAVSELGFSPIPGDQIARQLYEMRKSEANASLAACVASERAAERQRRVVEQPVQLVPQPPPERPDTRLERAVARAVLDGRCDDAREIALAHAHLDMAEQALRLCSPAAPKAAAAAIPIEPASLIGPSDYPADAISQRQQGRVTTALRVGSDGFVQGCDIAQSSGSPSLDQATCALILNRAVFAPASDQGGKSVSSTTTLSVVWMLPKIK
jgi:TonB family protein